MSRTLTALATVAIAAAGIGVSMWRYPEVQEMARVTPGFPPWASPAEAPGSVEPDEKPLPEEPTEDAPAPQPEESAEPSIPPAAPPLDGVDAGPPEAEEHRPLTDATGETTADEDSPPPSGASAIDDGPSEPAPEEGGARPASLERPGWTDPRESSDWSPREPQPLTLEALQRGPALVPVAPSGGGAEPAIATPAPPTGAQVIPPGVESPSSSHSWEAGTSYTIRPLPPVDGAPAPRISSRGAWPQEPIPLYPSTGR